MLSLEFTLINFFAVVPGMSGYHFNIENDG